MCMPCGRKAHLDCMLLGIRAIHIHSMKPLTPNCGASPALSAAEVGATDNFKSTIMSDFLAGKVEPPAEDDDLFSAAKRKRTSKPKPVKLSREAKAVMAAGRELWRYYHKQPKANPNASFYDIRLHFQGVRVTASGKEMMNSDSPDATYTKLLAKLRAAHKALAKAIEPKVYEYGFLKR